jgi:hypothetical protein
MEERAWHRTSGTYSTGGARNRYFSHREADAAEQRTVSDTLGRFVFEDVPAGAWLSLVHDDMHAGHGYVSGANVSDQIVHPGRTTLIFDGGPGSLEVELTAGERREITLPASTRGGR